MTQTVSIQAELGTPEFAEMINWSKTNVGAGGYRPASRMLDHQEWTWFQVSGEPITFSFKSEKLATMFKLKFS